MIGAVVLGIFAMIYVQSAQNRANFSLIADLMSFREQVMTYYSSVVANRGAWECTIQANSGLKTYLQSGGADKSGTLNIRDYSGNCQEGFGSGAGAELIPLAGLGLNIQDYNDIPLSSARACTGAQFCLKATWKGLDTAVGQRRGVELKLTLTANRSEIKQQLGVNFELIDKEHTIYMNRTVATDCSDGRVTGLFPGGRARHPTGKGVVAYAGDTAVVSLDAVTGLVQCSTRGPLVIPPCYDVTSTTNNPFLSGTGLRVSGVDSGKGFGDLNRNFGLRCDGGGRTTTAAIKGSCPRTSSGGTTAIAYFDPQTGIAQCSHPNILVEKVDNRGRSRDYINRHYCDGDNRFGIVRINETGTFTCSTALWGTSRGGVEPTACGTNQAVSEFSDSGARRCVSGGTPSMRGLSGPQGERGMSGRDIYNQHNSTQRYVIGYDSDGDPIYRTSPSGRGVGSPGIRGSSVPCDTGGNPWPHSRCFRRWQPCS